MLNEESRNDITINRFEGVFSELNDNIPEAFQKFTEGINGADCAEALATGHWANHLLAHLLKCALDPASSPSLGMVESVDLATFLLEKSPYNTFGLDDGENQLLEVHRLWQPLDSENFESCFKLFRALYDHRRPLRVSADSCNWLANCLQLLYQEIRSGRGPEEKLRSVCESLQYFANHTTPFTDLQSVLIQMFGFVDLVPEQPRYTPTNDSRHRFLDWIEIHNPAWEYASLVFRSLILNEHLWREVTLSSNPWWLDKVNYVFENEEYTFSFLSHSSALSSLYCNLYSMREALLYRKYGNSAADMLAKDRIDINLLLRMSECAVPRIRHIKFQSETKGLMLERTDVHSLLGDKIEDNITLHDRVMLCERASLALDYMKVGEFFDRHICQALCGLAKWTKPFDDLEFPRDPALAMIVVDHVRFLCAFYRRSPSAASLPENFFAVVDDIVHFQSKSNLGPTGKKDFTRLKLFEIGQPSVFTTYNIEPFAQLLAEVDFSSCDARSKPITTVLNIAEQFSWAYEPSVEFCDQFLPSLGEVVQRLPRALLPLVYNVLDVSCICQLLERPDLVHQRGALLNILYRYLQVIPLKELAVEPTNNSLVSNFTDLIIFFHSLTDEFGYEDGQPDFTTHGFVQVVNCMIVLSQSKPFSELALNFPPLLISLRHTIERFAQSNESKGANDVVITIVSLLRLWTRWASLGAIQKLHDHEFTSIILREEISLAMGNSKPAQEALGRLRRALAPH